MATKRKKSATKRKKSGGRKSQVRGTVDPRALSDYRKVEAVLSPLLDLFATVDDVLGEYDAFDPNQINKSLGRIYREWLNTRESLDPSFDRARYRHDMKAHQATKRQRSPLGRKLPVSASQNSSSGHTSISEKNRKESAAFASRSLRASAKRVRSAGRVFGGQYPQVRSSGYGEGSPSVSGRDSESGSAKRGTRRSPSTKD